MASDLELSPAAVERGARAIHNGQGCTCRLGAKGDAEVVLTAALRLDDPETIERVAKACRRANAERAHDDFITGSDTLDEEDREMARAAISALLGAEPEEAEE